jgi:hypothetical protein
VRLHTTSQVKPPDVDNFTAALLAKRSYEAGPAKNRPRGEARKKMTD